MGPLSQSWVRISVCKLAVEDLNHAVTPQSRRQQLRVRSRPLKVFPPGAARHRARVRPPSLPSPCPRPLRPVHDPEEAVIVPIDSTLARKTLPPPHVFYWPTLRNGGFKLAPRGGQPVMVIPPARILSIHRSWDAHGRKPWGQGVGRVRGKRQLGGSPQDCIDHSARSAHSHHLCALDRLMDGRSCGCGSGELQETHAQRRSNGCVRPHRSTEVWLEPW